MKRELMESTSQARDFCALTKAILALCEPFEASASKVVAIAPQPPFEPRIAAN